MKNEKVMLLKASVLGQNLILFVIVIFSIVDILEMFSFSQLIIKTEAEDPVLRAGKERAPALSRAGSVLAYLGVEPVVTGEGQEVESGRVQTQAAVATSQIVESISQLQVF